MVEQVDMMLRSASLDWAGGWREASRLGGIAREAPGQASDGQDQGEGGEEEKEAQRS
jgi:hypothetical protein